MEGPADTCKPYKGIKCSDRNGNSVVKAALLHRHRIKTQSCIAFWEMPQLLRKSEATSWQQQHLQHKSKNKGGLSHTRTSWLRKSQTEQFWSKSRCGLGHYRPFEAKTQDSSQGCTGLLLCLPSSVT